MHEAFTSGPIDLIFQEAAIDDVLSVHPKWRIITKAYIPAAIQNHEAVISYYHLPVRDLALEITARINRGQFTWENDFKDLYPPIFGHEIYFNSIKRLFEAAWPNELGEKSNQVPSPTK